MDTVYKFDISRLSVLDWYYWGYAGQFNLKTITYLINKSALFDLLAMPASEHENIGYAFGMAVNAYLNQFIVDAPTPPTLDISTEDINALFRRIKNEN